MQLRNKKTGEITEDIWYEYADENIRIKGETKVYEYNSLAELNEEWEDYEEPKTEFYITAWGDIREYTTKEERFAFKQKLEIGNYFETKEEAEKAVEKLKAIKILKDNGFRFIQWEFDMKTIADGKIWFDVGINTQWNAEQLLDLRPEVEESLDLLFGGEE